MKPTTCVLTASLALFAMPYAAAVHNVCDNDATDVSVIGVVGVDDPNTGLDGIFVCVGTEAVGVDPDVYAGPSYGATVRVLTCSGLGCGVVVDNTGALLVPVPSPGLVCIGSTCYEPVVCVLRATCP